MVSFLAQCSKFVFNVWCDCYIVLHHFIFILESNGWLAWNTKIPVYYGNVWWVLQVSFALSVSYNHSIVNIFRNGTLKLDCLCSEYAKVLELRNAIIVPKHYQIIKFPFSKQKISFSQCQVVQTSVINFSYNVGINKTLCELILVAQKWVLSGRF